MYFLTDPSGLPKAADHERAALGLERWRETAARTDDEGLADFVNGLAENPAGRALLEAIFGNSPHLTHITLFNCNFFRHLLNVGPDAAFAGLLAELREQAAPAGDGTLSYDVALSNGEQEETNPFEEDNNSQKALSALPS